VGNPVASRAALAGEWARRPHAPRRHSVRTDCTVTGELDEAHAGAGTVVSGVDGGGGRGMASRRRSPPPRARGHHCTGHCSRT
jgi:hypothetical protein